jgi:hypothetical protein
LILLTQGQIHEILAKIAQLLVVVEKLSFFESAIFVFVFFAKRNFLFPSNLFELVIVYGIPRIKVIIEKSRGEVSLMGQDTIENVS